MRLPAAFILALAVISLSCSRASVEIAEGALYSCDDYTVWPDSFVSTTTCIVPHRLDSIRHDRPMLAGGDSLLVYLFNRAETASTVDRFLDPLLYPAESLAAINHRLDSLDNHKDTSSGWPIVDTTAPVLIDAIEVYYITGDNKLRSRLQPLIARHIEQSYRYCRDAETGLITGASPDNLTRRLYPSWADVADIATSISFENNINHAMLLNGLAHLTDDRAEQARYHAMADTLIRAIDSNLWLPNMHFYAALAYGRPYSVVLQSADVMAQSRAIIASLLHPAIADAAIAGTPVNAAAIRHYNPMPADNTAPDLKSTALYAIAAARRANAKALNTAVAMTIAAIVNSGIDDCGPLRAVILRGVLGIDCRDDERLTFHPFVTTEMSESHTLTGLKYRDAVIDITVNGHGNIVSTFAIDGVTTDDHTFPATLSGRHRVTITLVGSDSSSDGVNIIPLSTLAPPPTLHWSETGLKTTITDSDGSPSTLLYLNGQLIEQMSLSAYSLPAKSPTTAVTIVALNAGAPGYAARPHLYCPQAVTVNYADVARPYARSLRDKQLARSLVETTRYRNRSLPVNVNIDRPGDYYATVTFVNGEGIVNPERQYALRTLTVNNRDTNLVVFAQLNPDNWRPDLDWQRSQGETLPIRITLDRGNNLISLDYFTPQTGSPNHDINTLIPLSLNLYPIASQ